MKRFARTRSPADGSISVSRPITNEPRRSLSRDARATWEQEHLRMRVSIHQPSYWPWLGQLAKIAKSDRYVFLDSVDAARDDFQYRNLFFCNGQAKFLTLPVNYRMSMPI